MIAKKSKEIEYGIWIHFAAAVDFDFSAYQLPETHINLAEGAVFVDIGCFQEIVNDLFFELLLNLNHLVTNLGQDCDILPLHI